ncbi:hypothetical protein [Streptomyces sp. DG1A-41]|uniref:hypothetical protein n=1 Tax=Streptomyces sp. DG1A-41 TaxID=3125779 RepID=UPI0030D49943
MANAPFGVRWSRGLAGLPGEQVALQAQLLAVSGADDQHALCGLRGVWSYAWRQGDSSRISTARGAVLWWGTPLAEMYQVRVVVGEGSRRFTVPSSVR